MVPFFVEFWCPKASQNEAKIHQKINQKINAILHWKKDNILSKKGAQMGSQGSQNMNFGGPLGCLFHDHSQVPKMDAKWVQNAVKIGPTWSQNLAKID